MYGREVKMPIIRTARYLIHSGVLLIAVAMSVTSLCSKEGTLHLRFDSGRSKTWREDGYRIERLPFAIGISRIEGIPQNYKAYILSIKEKSSVTEKKVTTGKAAIHHGYKFLPTLEDEDKGGVWLHVTQDTVGEPLAFAGFIILILGMSISMTARILLMSRSPLSRSETSYGIQNVGFAGICVMVCDVVWLIYRAAGEGVFPAVSISDTLALTSLTSAALIIVATRKWGPEIQSSGLIISILTMAGAVATGIGIHGHPAALEHPLLSIHVCLIMSSYAIFGTLAASAIWVLANRYTKKGYHLAEHIYTRQRVLIYVGETLLTVGIAAGSVWAADAWGKYWSWDAKEIWALIVMLIYLLPPHTRYFPALKKGIYLEIFLIIASVSILFTWFGVNQVFGGLHSY